MAKSSKGRPRAVSVAKVDMKVVLAVVVCLALSAATYFLFTAPMRKDAAQLKVQVASEQAKLARAQARINDITSGKKSGAAELLTQATELDSSLPADVDKVALVAAIPGLASGAGVTVNQMDPVATPDPPTKGAGSLKSQAFTVAATGRVEALAAWIEQLQSYPATLSVSGLAVNVAGNQATANFTLKAFYVPTATLAPKS